MRSKNPSASKLVEISGILFSVIVFTYTLLNIVHRNQDNTSKYATNSRIDSLENKINIMQLSLESKNGYSKSVAQIDSVLNSQKSINDASIRFKIYQLQTNINFLAQRTNALVQAFNPTKPEEVITIARLKDKIDEIVQKQDQITDQFKSQQTTFEDSIKQQVSSTTNYILLIVIAFVPLILTVIYNLWRDNRSTKSMAKENPE